MTSDLLAAVVAGSRRSAEERARTTPMGALERSIAAAANRPSGSGFRDTLRATGVRVIAECKRRSPSRGVLRAAYDPVAIAKGYEAAGAAAISVLTERTFFDGALDHLAAVRAAVSVPLLCKDFLVTDYQLLEAAAAGASAALLIVAALDDEALARLIRRAASIDLATLVEVHDRDELQRALDAGAAIVGVNSRNLRTLTVDPGVLEAIGPSIPRDVVAVAESGLKTPDDLRRLRACRYDAFLIGERFMTAPDPGRALADLLAAAAVEAVR